MNILLTSAGRRSYMVKYFKDALGSEGKVYTGNSSAISAAFLAADQSVITPLIHDPGYIPFLYEYCEQQKIEMIIPLFDIDLPILAAAKEGFKARGIEVIVSGLSVIQICNDKWKTFCFLKEHGFSVPKTYLTVNEAKTALQSGQINFPVIIKPRWGMGSLSIFIADDFLELEVLYKKCEKEIQKSYLQFEAEQDRQHSVIIQEMISGDEYGLDVINDLNGQYQTTIVKKKLAMRSGETDAAQIVSDAKVEQLGADLAFAMKHIANLDVDLIITGNNYYMIDLNARFGGGYPYSHMAGTDLPKAIINWVSGGQVQKELLAPQIGLCYCKDIMMKQLG